MQTSQFTTQQKRVAQPTRGRNNFVQTEFRPGTRAFRERVAAEREAAKPKPPAAPSYTSSIPTTAGITGSQARQITATPQVYRGGGSAANQSRDAYARAMSQIGSNQQANNLDQYRQAYQAEGEQARSRDVMAQRQNEQGRYAFNVEADRTQRQQTQQYNRDLREIANYRRNAAKGHQSTLMTSALGAVFGQNLLSNLMVPSARSFAGGARPFGGGLMSGLLGR